MSDATLVDLLGALTVLAVIFIIWDHYKKVTVPNAEYESGYAYARDYSAVTLGDKDAMASLAASITILPQGSITSFDQGIQAFIEENNIQPTGPKEPA